MFDAQFVGGNQDDQKVQRGLIAQEVEQVIPELVATSQALKDGEVLFEGFKSLDYSRLVVDLVGAVQELKKENELVRAALEKDEKARQTFEFFAKRQIKKLNAQVAEFLET